jgi:ABC-type sugar transport system ATPase subunit
MGPVPDQPTSDQLLRMTGISKSFAGVTALADVSFDLNAGEIHALMGENGAGKSTLMKILSGLYRPNAGEIILRGEPKSFSGTQAAQEAGIAIIHQEFNLFPNLSAAENIFLDRAGFTSRLGRIEWGKVNEAAKKLINSIGADFDVRREVQHLSVHSQQVLEIAKAISFNADILIMDEPSAALPENEVQNMFRVVRELKRRGVGIVYVSHRMHEIFQIADRVTVLRDGRKISTKAIADTSPPDLIHMMIGKEVGSLYGEGEGHATRQVVMRVSNLELSPAARVSFDLHKGEILGLFGLVGSGAQTIAAHLFGLTPGSGRIEIDGKVEAIDSPAAAMRRGIALVPADRHRQGLIRQMSVAENVSMGVAGQVAPHGVIDRKREEELAAEYKKLLDMRIASLDQPVEALSGGNQQKVVLAKWLATKPKVLVLVEPTRGVDVGAKQEIYRIIREISGLGFSIVLISTEMPEVIGMSDRILVLREGSIVAEFQRGEASQEGLLSVASRPTVAEAAP